MRASRSLGVLDIDGTRNNVHVITQSAVIRSDSPSWHSLSSCPGEPVVSSQAAARIQGRRISFTPQSMSSQSSFSDNARPLMSTNEASTASKMANGKHSQKVEPLNIVNNHFRKCRCLISASSVEKTELTEPSCDEFTRFLPSRFINNSVEQKNGINKTPHESKRNGCDDQNNDVAQPQCPGGRSDRFFFCCKTSTSCVFTYHCNDDEVLNCCTIDRGANNDQYHDCAVVDTGNLFGDPGKGVGF